MSVDGTDMSEVAGGTTEEANSAGSSQAGGQSSITVADTAKQIEALQKQVEQLTRSLQSGKDKAVARTNQRIDVLERDIKSVLRDAMKSGQSVQDILGEIEAGEERETREALAELARSYRSGTFGKESRGNDSGNGVDVTNVIRELELDESDASVQLFRSKKFANEAEAYREAAKLLKQARQPSDADMPSHVAKKTQNADAMTRLRQEYEEGSKNLRGQALIRYKMQMRQKGLKDLY